MIYDLRFTKCLAAILCALAGAGCDLKAPDRAAGPHDGPTRVETLEGADLAYTVLRDRQTGREYLVVFPGDHGCGITPLLETRGSDQ